MAPTELKTVSCDKCRSLKVKCVKEEAESACSKCLKSGHRCITTQTPLDRRQKTPKDRVRLRDLATRLDSVLDHFTKSDEDKAASTLKSPFDTSAGLATDTHGRDAGADLTDSTTDISHQGSSTTSSSYNDWHTRIGLDQWLLAHLLQRYRMMQHYFPFVVVLESWDVAYMLRSRPTLFLAVSASAACHYPRVQQALNRELKEVLSRRVLVGGGTSLELLQTVLVYLAWFQYYLVPRSQLVYRYLQVAVSMTVDLNLVLHESPSFFHRGRLLSASDDSPGSFSETRRASLGCYYLSSSISSWLLKPNTLALNDGVLGYADTLDQACELDSDMMVKPLMQHQKMLEDVVQVYRSDRRTRIPSRLHLETKQMMQNLDLWWISLPQYMRSMCFFTTRYHHLRIRIFEMSLFYHFRVRDKTPISITRYPALGANLLACIDAIKDYLDALLTMESSEWNHLPCEEWSRLIIACFVLYKLSVGPREISGWDVEVCRSRVDLEIYLGAVADHICNSRQSLGKSEESIESIYFVLPDILRSARASFVTARDSPHLVKPGDRAHMNLSKENIRAEITRPKVQRRCPVTTMWADRALLLDQETDWRTVESSRALDPAEQLARNESLWRDLLGMQLGTENG